MKSILAADCGNTTTTAILIESVGDGYRLKAAGQAPSTYGSPWKDITVGVQEAVRHIEKVVGRTLLAPGGWPITPQNDARQGVDAFTIVSSAGRPLQVLVAGLMPDISLASARHVVATTYAHLISEISLDTHDNNQQPSLEARIQTIQEDKPEVILLVGGTDGGAEQPIIELAQVISMALQIWQGREKPGVLYAGNRQLRSTIADILGPVTTLKSVDNIRPTLDIENLGATRIELENLYLQRKMLQLPGFEKLSHLSQYPVVPASKSFEKLIAYLGQHNNSNVIGVDIGSWSTVVTAHTPKQLRSTTRSDAGVGHSLASLLKIIPVEKFHRWLPFELSPEELYNRLLNKSLNPTSIPTTEQDLMIEQAVAREALRLVFSQTRGTTSTTYWDLIIGAGRTLTGTPHAAQAALVLIDSIEPWGITNLALDRNGAVNMLGSIAAIEPMAAVEVVAQDAFLNLGTVVAPAGHGRQPGKPALRIKLRQTKGKIFEKEIAYGTIEMINLPPGQKATLELWPLRHFDIGLGQPGRGAIAEDVEGGVLGIIIDARGRPLKLPREDTQRQEQLRQWQAALRI
jgi:hypothetical protein